MKKNIFGVGVDVMMFRTRYTKEMEEHVRPLLAKIAAQEGIVARLQGGISSSLSKAIALKANLLKAQEYTNSLIVTRDLVDKTNAEMSKLKEMYAECSAALDRAGDAFPSHAAFSTEGRAKIPTTVSGGRVFLAEKSGGKTDLAAVPGPKTSIDPKTTLGDIQLGRRFQ